MWREVLRKCHRGGGGDIIYWGIILRWRGGWIDSLQSTTLCDENTNVIQIHQIQWVTHTHTNSTWLESKYNMARFFGLATRSKYCMYISLELCDAEGSEVDTLFMFLWHPMHENDLKSRACSTYSSLSNYQEKWNDDDTKKKVWWFTSQWLGNTWEGPKIFLDIFAKPQKVGCFFYECWIDLAASSWLTSRLKRNVQIYLGRYTSKLCDTVKIQRTANTAQCIPCRRGIASKSEDNFRNDSLAFYRLHPGIPGCTGGTARQYGGGQPENLENKH